MTRVGSRLLPHTADLFVEARAGDFASLCSISVEALFSVLTDRRRIRRAQKRILEFPVAPPEELLLSVLRRSLLLFSLERFLVRHADVVMTAKKMVVSLEGEPMDAARHSIGRELKAVTAHAVAVESGISGIAARFVLDV